MTGNATALLIAYLVSAFGGHFLIGGLMHLMRMTTGQPKEKIYEWVPFWIGCTERFVATTLVILAPRYVGAFVATWVTLKLAASWQRMSGTKETVRVGTLLSLVGSAWSFIVAIAAGLYINWDAALRAWASAS